MKKLAYILVFLCALAACQEEPVPVGVESVKLNMSSLSLSVGDSEILVATVLPSNAENKNVVWASNNKGVATVNNGTVTAVGAGEAIIVVTTEDGGRTAECKVSVKKDTDNPDNNNGTKSIAFEDPLVKSVLLKQGVDKNNDKEISYKEAAEVTHISFAVDGNTDITGEGYDEMYEIKKFNEFQYFTNVTDISGMFCGCETLEEITLHDNIEIIGSWAFNICNLSEIVIPDSVTKIGDYAFGGCEKLEYITLPNTLSQIGDYAFGGCIKLENITLPQSLSHIGEGAFGECISLKSITLPDSVVKIGEVAFCTCENLSSIKLSESLIEIGDDAFSETGLSSVTIPASVQNIGVSPFTDCLYLQGINVSSGNSRYHSHEGVLYSNDNELIQYPAGKESRKYVIPSGTTNISAYALRYCSLEELIIPETVTEIKPYAFSKSEITSIHIPTSIKSIGDNAFVNIQVDKIYTDDLTAWNMMFDDYIDTYDLLENSSLYINNELITELVINTYTNLWAFSGLSGINKVIIAEGVKSIEHFDIGPNVKTVIIPTSLQNIESRIGVYSENGETIYPELDIYISDLEAWCKIYSTKYGWMDDNYKYANNSNIYLNGKLLTDLIIPESVEEFGYQFSGCRSIESVTFHKAIQTIGNFEGCANLTDIYLPSDERISIENCFPAGTRIHVVPELSDSYASSYPDYIFYAYYFDKTWGISGTFNNWGETPDTEMVEDGPYYMAKGIELTTNSEFKFRLDNNWAVNYGGVSTDASMLEEDNKTKSDGSNIRITESGKYDIYLAKDYSTYRIVPEGESIN